MTLIEDEPPSTLPRIASMLAAVQVRLGLGVIAPVEHVVFVHLAHAERDVDERIAIAAAGFEQQHASRRRPRSAGSPARSRPSRADDDVVVAFAHSFLLLIASSRFIRYARTSLVPYQGWPTAWLMRWKASRLTYRACWREHFLELDAALTQPLLVHVSRDGFEHRRARP